MRLACWLESLAVALHPLQRLRAETGFSQTRNSAALFCFTEVRERGDALTSTRDARATQRFGKKRFRTLVEMRRARCRRFGIVD